MLKLTEIKMIREKDWWTVRRNKLEERPNDGQMKRKAQREREREKGRKEERQEERDRQRN